MGYAEKCHDDYCFLLSCNSEVIAGVWESWDGMDMMVVNGRAVEEGAVVSALLVFGYPVVIG